MSFYIELRWWVDRNWVEGIGYKSKVWLGILPFLPIPIVGEWWIWLAVPLAIAWFGFVSWRGWRVARANDANFDRKTKFLLSKEYLDSEGAMKARLRRRRKKRADAE